MRLALAAVAASMLLTGTADAAVYAGGAVEHRDNVRSLVFLHGVGAGAAARVDGFLRCGGDEYQFSDDVSRTATESEGRWVARHAGSFRVSAGAIRYRWRLRVNTGEDGGKGSVVSRATRSGAICKTVRSRVIVRRIVSAPVESAEPPTAASGFYGATRYGGPARGMTMKLTDKGQIFASWTAQANCLSGQPLFFRNLTPLTPVRDGRFLRRERFSVHYSGATRPYTIKYRVRFGGRFTTTGARGTTTMSARVFVGGKRVDRCLSLDQRWIAFRG